MQSGVTSFAHRLGLSILSQAGVRLNPGYFRIITGIPGAAKVPHIKAPGHVPGTEFGLQPKNATA